jgi:diguanylate cyclase (GGDEF)-like protein
MSSFRSISNTNNLVSEEIELLRSRRYGRLRFPDSLEEKFENDTRKERSYRLWLEGLIAIVVLNVCLLADYLFVKDRLLSSIVKQTEIVTPVALVVNYMMRLNLPAWAREGSVAAGMTVICFINLYAEGGNTAATASFGLMSVLITLLFVNVVMRLRFVYAASATVLMTAGGLLFTAHTIGLKPSEQVVGASMMCLGAALTLTAVYSLERQERLNYLLVMSSEMQTAELHRLSNIDRLTDLPNRRAFDERFEALWEQGVHSKTQLSVVLIDIDHFKIVNDVYGHLYGDEVLRRVASLLPKSLRTHIDFAARFGGEEFIVLLPDTNQKLAIEVAERIRQTIERAGSPVSGNGDSPQMLKVTVSCGVSLCVPDRGLRKEKLLKHADRALYKAKEEGRNRVEFRVCEPPPVVASEEASAAKSSAMRRLARIKASNRLR